MEDAPLRLPVGALVVLVGPSGAGKSSWAASAFRPEQVVASDAIRALVGEGEHDQRAGKDAFDVLELVLERRLRRGLTTVVDTLGLDGPRRRRWQALARSHDRGAHVVAFDVSPDVCRARNRQRPRRVPEPALAAQLRSWDAVRAMLPDEGWDAVHAPAPVRLVAPDLLHAPDAARRQEEDPMSLRFGLQLPRFAWTGGAADLADRLAAVARAAEDAGFTSLWVMDHLVQIPQVGREWEDLPEPWTTLAFLAAHTRTARLGTLVSPITFRPVALTAKLVATLDVLSRGRAIAGLGLGWFAREHEPLGLPFPPVGERYELLEDALEALPLLWGKGAPAYEGRRLRLAGALSYPRPLQEHVPILVGGSGERRTLRLVAQHADACNLFGDADTVRRKVEVLHEHCATRGRDLTTVRITHLSTAPAAGEETIDERIGRYRLLAEAGVQTAIVGLADLDGPEQVERFTEVIAAFPPDASPW